MANLSPREPRVRWSHSPQSFERVVSTTWLIDAFNVLGSRPDGWWRDRTGALATLVEDIAAWKSGSDRVRIVIDGYPRSDIPEGAHRGVTVDYAHRGGPDGADDAIVELVARVDHPAAVRVVTSDAGLRRRVNALGAEVEGAGTFRSRFDRA